MEWYGIAWFVCLFETFVTIENFSLIKRRHQGCKCCYAKLCSATMTVEQWGFFSVWHLLLHCVRLQSEDQRHFHPWFSVKQWNCHYLIWRLKSVAAGIQTFNLLHARQTLKSIAPPPRLPLMNSLKYITTLAYTVLHSLDQQMFSPRWPAIVFASDAVIPQGCHVSHWRRVGNKHLQSFFSTVVNICEILA